MPRINTPLAPRELPTCSSPYRCRSSRRKVGESPAMTGLTIGIIISELVAIWLAWRIFRSPDPLLLRVATAIVAFIPFVGPLVAYWSANFPPPHHPAFRDNQRYSSDVYERWVSVLRTKDPKTRLERWKRVMEVHEKRE
jgi:hypothetical protein